ncbi:MAG: putative peptide zinc metalloprotease protein [Paracoccaceae bacterium]|jgi:putative peptide zinc metalloprotease protein
MSKRTFYDQWHRISELRIGLRSAVTVRLHHYRSEPWYVYYDPGHNGFFRARPETHRLVLEISPERTLNEIWRSFVDTSPKTAPGQQDFFELIMALYKANMIFIEGGVSETRLLERALKKKKKPLPAKISELLFFRIPLWDPEPFLERSKSAINVVYSWPVVLMVALVVLWAGVEFALGSDRIFAQSGSILQSHNLISLFIATFATHFFHELSHAALCKYFGGHVRTMGIMLLMFTPLPYADVSASWSMRNPKQRAMIGAAGMYADLFFCAVSVVVWAYSPPGAINEIAMNLMFVTAVYTFVFNINPLMRFDGYYILSDLTAIPNLHTAAKTQFDAVFRKIFLKEPFKPTERVSTRRRVFLYCFFVTSFIYRNMVMIGIVLFVADQYFGFGMMAAAAVAYNSFIAPLGKVLKPLRNPQFMSKHKIGLRISAIILAVLVFAFLFVPLPYSRYLDGIVEAQNKTRVFIPHTGIIDRVDVRSGESVTKGQIVVTLTNPELDKKRDVGLARLQGAKARAQDAISKGSVELAAIQQEILSIADTLLEMDRNVSQLVIHAEQDGTWISGGVEFQSGTWVMQGTEVGQIVNDQDHKFLAVVKQETGRAIALFDPNSASIKVEGNREATYKIKTLKIIPYSRNELPSAALTPLAGGNVAISTSDPNDPKAIERFFLVAATLDGTEKHVSIIDGRSGWLRIELPPLTAAQRTVLTIRQFFQKRYKL